MTDNQGKTAYGVRENGDREFDMLAARQAVERARRQVARAGGRPHHAVVDRASLAADAEAAASVETALIDASRRSRRPFGAKARKRVAALELAKRLVGDRTTDAADRRSAPPGRPNETVQPDDGQQQRQRIDLLELARAYHDLTLAEDQLARLLFSVHAAVAPSSGSASPASPDQAT